MGLQSLASMHLWVMVFMADEHCVERVCVCNAGASRTEPLHKDSGQEPGRDSVQAAAQVQARGQGSQEGSPAQRGARL